VLAQSRPLLPGLNRNLHDASHQVDFFRGRLRASGEQRCVGGSIPDMRPPVAQDSNLAPALIDGVCALTVQATDVAGLERFYVAVAGGLLQGA
jgi:hypothetical protein